MSIQKIVDVYLYTKDAFNSTSFCGKAKKFLEDSGIEFTLLNYADESQHSSVFSALNTWWPEEADFKSFPFVIYTEIHDHHKVGDILPKKYIIGLTAIKKSNIAELYQLDKE